MCKSYPVFPQKILLRHMSKHHRLCLRTMTIQHIPSETPLAASTPSTTNALSSRSVSNATNATRRTLASSPVPHRPESTHSHAAHRPTPAHPNNRIYSNALHTNQGLSSQVRAPAQRLRRRSVSHSPTLCANTNNAQTVTIVRTNPTAGGAQPKPTAPKNDARNTTYASSYSHSPVITSADVCGPLALWALAERGILYRLDSSCGYLIKEERTVSSRAHIISKLIPVNTVASGLLAYWVWMGGTFPDCFDIISASHYWSVLHERPVHATNRILGDHHIITAHGLHITSPIRTVCDISCFRMKGSHHAPPAPSIRTNRSSSEQHRSYSNDERESKGQYHNTVRSWYGCDVTLPESRSQESAVLQRMQDMITTYDIAISECLTELWGNNHWPDRSIGIRRWTTLSPYSADYPDSAQYDYTQQYAYGYAGLP